VRHRCVRFLILVVAKDSAVEGGVVLGTGEGGGDDFVGLGYALEGDGGALLPKGGIEGVSALERVGGRQPRRLQSRA
jgi:hypothetical protein